eukprot:TRINITY_DN1163_c0_g1_i1.p1 TRINITY_DN1163_c0_g1~~TRINITY_DN1163_c0_g1_i1.p1  ORF type:complete len:1017 (+),score=310.67 TRINITY_DN1163_c0_g1_i1:73-3123(+)
MSLARTMRRAVLAARLAWLISLAAHAAPAAAADAAAEALALVQQRARKVDPAAAAHRDPVDFARRALGRVEKRMQDLEQHLAQAERENDAAAAKQQAALLHQQKLQKASLAAAAKERTRINDQMSSVNSETQALRRQAGALVEANQGLAALASELRTNLSLASELVSQALAAKSEVDDASLRELLVENELGEDGSNATSGAAPAAAKAAKAAKALLLQLNAEGLGDDLTEPVRQALAAMTEQQRLEQRSASAKLKKSLAAGDKQQEETEASLNALNEELASAKRTRRQLQNAVEHLKKKHDELKDNLQRFSAIAARAVGLPTQRPSLLQIQAGVRSKALPDLAEVRKHTQETVGSVESQVDMLNDELEAERLRSRDKVADMATRYRVELKAQEAENSRLRATKVALESDIRGADGATAAASANAEAVEKESRELLRGLRALRANISVAQKFVDRQLADGALSTGAGALESVPELRVLAEMDEESAQAERDRLLGVEEQSPMSLLELHERVQVSRRPPDEGQPAAAVAEAPGQAQEMLLGSVLELAGADASAESEVDGKFEASRSQGEALQKELRQDVDRLAVRNNSAHASLANVTKALGALNATRAKLRAGMAAFRAFARRLGARHLPDSKDSHASEPQHHFSLLQVSAKPGPKHKVSAKPGPKHKVSAKLGPKHKAKKALKHVAKGGLSQLNSGVSALSSKLASEKRRAMRQLSQLRASLERNLSKRHGYNSDLEHGNAKLEQHLASLHKEAARLRAEASERLAENERLREALSQLRVNMTTAQEYAAKALVHSANVTTEADPDLAVLSELQLADEQQHMKDARLAALAHIAPNLGIVDNDVEKSALLQVDAQSKRWWGAKSWKKVKEALSLVQQDGGDVVNDTVSHKKTSVADGVISSASMSDAGNSTKEVIQSLVSTLGDLTKAREASEAALKHKFQEEYENAVKHTQALLQRKAELEALVKPAQERVHRLRVAVKRLKASGKALSQKQHEVLGFLGKLADGPRADEHVHAKL